MFATKSTRAARSALVILGAAAIASFAPLAGAADDRQDAVPSSYPALQSMTPVDVMHVIDAEKKGYVTKEEFLKFQEAVFDKIDRDRNRRLSEVEFTDRG